MSKLQQDLSSVGLAQETHDLVRTRASVPLQTLPVQDLLQEQPEDTHGHLPAVNVLENLHCCFIDITLFVKLRGLNLFSSTQSFPCSFM